MATEERAGAAVHARSDDGDVSRWRRIIPSSALGLAGLLFCMSVASAFTGAVLYAYYEYQLGKTEDRVDQFQAGFEDRVDEAVSKIDDERDAAVGAVQTQLDDLEKFAASGETLAGILEKTSPSVWFVSTLDEAGQPSVGSAFVVASDGDKTLMVTSYTTVRAATRTPGPPINIRKGDQQLKATLHTWQEEKDLALLIVDKGGMTKLPFAGKDASLKTGERIFAVSGLGASGGAISQGFVADVSSAGIQHDAAIGSAFQGGPLLNDKGEVLAVASRAYAPLGFGTDAVFFGVPIRSTCDKILKCPDGGEPSAGSKP